jgi:hypothetical protein
LDEVHEDLKGKVEVLVMVQRLIFVLLNRTGVHKPMAYRRSSAHLSLVVEPPFLKLQPSYHKKILPQG